MASVYNARAYTEVFNYGVQADGVGAWSLSGSFGAGDVGLWQLQAVFGSAASSQVSTPVDIRILNP